jgi:hypothetical protein
MKIFETSGIFSPTRHPCSQFISISKRPGGIKKSNRLSNQEASLCKNLIIQV